MFGIFKRTTPSDSARVLSQVGHGNHKAAVRARVDQMRADMGLVPARWPS